MWQNMKRTKYAKHTQKKQEKVHLSQRLICCICYSSLIVPLLYRTYHVHEVECQKFFKKYKVSSPNELTVAYSAPGNTKNKEKYT